MSNMLSEIMNNMGLRGHAEPFTVLKFITKRVLFEPENTNGDRIYTIRFLTVVFISGFPFFIGLLGHLLMATSDKMISERIESLSYISHAIVHCTYGATYYFFGKELKMLTHKICTKRRIKEFLPDFYNLNRMGLFFFIITSILVIIHIAYNFLLNKHCIGRGVPNDERFVCGLIVPAWFPFKFDTKISYSILFLWYFAFSIVFIPLGTTFCVIPIGFPLMMITKIKIFRKHIEEVNEVKSRNFKDKFPMFVEAYGEITWCMKYLNNTMGYLYTCQYVFEYLTISLMGYNILIMKNYVDLGRLVIWVVMEYSLCQCCQFVEDEHEKLINSFYNIPWYDLDPDMRQNYRMLLACMQMPFHVKCQPLSFLNNAFFLYIMRGTSSMLTFFLNFS